MPRFFLVALFCLLMPPADPEERAIYIVTYNVLNPKLCTPEWFPKCHPDALVESKRFELVQAKIRAWMEQTCIICLQEVSRKWGDLLAPLFSAGGYEFVLAEYGQHWQDFMGVLTAWPRDRFIVTERDTSRLTDLPTSQDLQAKMEPMLRHSHTTVTTLLPQGSWWRHMCDWLWSCLRDTVRRLKRSPAPPKPAAPPSKARCSNPEQPVFTPFNRIIWTCFECVNIPSPFSLSPSRFQFCVTNYHMPCKFKDSEFMQMQAYMLATATTQLSRGRPCILLGDLNIVRHTPPYLDLLKVFPDAVMVEFTCHTDNGINGPFKDQVDHFFLDRSEWRSVLYEDPTRDLSGHSVSDTLETQSLEKPESPSGPLPTLEEPSDHLPLFVELMPLGAPELVMDRVNG